jgi:hypothetical protein
VTDYLPEGYRFDRISYSAESPEALKTIKDADKYMSVYYTNGSEELYSQVRFMDETSAFDAPASKNIEEIKINGNPAVLDGNMLNVQIGDVMYMFSGSDGVDADELIKIAESLQ